jgi:hypothetical protein
MEIIGAVHKACIWDLSSAVYTDFFAALRKKISNRTSSTVSIGFDTTFSVAVAIESLSSRSRKGIIYGNSISSTLITVELPVSTADAVQH